MNILIVSGFLGAGKTTFIKELIRRTDTCPVVLENEYGADNIDAQELRNTGDTAKKPEVLEFMEGCVCCTMKDSFVNSVLTIYSGLSPEYLIVEPTGVGKLSNIISNLQPILHGDVSLLKPVVVIAPRSYGRNMHEWGELYRDQIANAGTIVFSKCENESPQILEEAAAAVRQINPASDIISEHYTRKSDEWWRSCMSLPSQTIEARGSKEDSPELSQLTLNNARLNNPGQLMALLEDCLHGELGSVVRAKGTIPVGDETLRFDLADGLYSITGSNENVNQCVFIGRNLDKEKLCMRLGALFNKKSLSLTRAYVRRQYSYTKKG
ncbi:GTP-binding protein [Butyrivibrio sp. JL13D10]|uniref:GTP-binding protein n=1 Tax=Butyrivibrio sp. JL13D10 TaxID=3236815 RepID=UPI0038B6954A